MMPSNEEIQPNETIQEHPGIHFRVSVERLIGFCAETKRTTKDGELIKVIQRAFDRLQWGSVFCDP